MRKLLLATVAVLGGSMGVSAVADAQSLVTTDDTAGQTASPAPGTVTVRLNGRVRFYAFNVTDKSTDGSGKNLSAAPAATAAAGAGGKQATYGFADYARLYSGFDGVAANGLKYGASLEIRQDQNAPAGGGANGSISAQDRSRAGLYFRREFGYIGTDQLGTIRLGSTDQPSSLYMTGAYENFDGGGLNGDVPALVTGNNQITWPFADVGGVYTTVKAVYLSPQFFGFDAGVSYEPSTANVLASNSCIGGIGGSGCERLASSAVNAESGRRKNTLDALLRYRGTFGGFGIAATAGYITGGHVADNSGLPFNSNRAIALPARDNYDGLNVGDFGLALTYAGFSIGGKYQFGRFNGSALSLVPRGLADGEALLGGFSYTFGPVVVGAHYLDYKSAGDFGNAYFGRQRRETGLAAGGTYSVAPGLAVFLSYINTQRRQNGYDFVTGAGVTTATGSAGTRTNNKVTAQLISIGTSFSW